ncbi:MAG: sulfotransferase domain-containing protein [Actinomycetia bacterium]|nr:sulfotransferase domain-containing protein [Actinomycetes bacterium]MCP5033271.1 sulfotransferase domain-containing protein [Actinomycetes bacterium]
MTPYGARFRAPEGLKPKSKAKALTTIRTFGQLTAGLRALPDYLIIGTKRGGTTSLARWLLEHPEVRSLYPARETRKGTYYFDVNYGRGQGWYQSHFPTRIGHRLAERRHGRPLLLGEATPYYLHHPHAPMRARQLVPGAKIIALLRHPVDRAHGHWAERSRQGVETLDFEQALEAEPRRLAGEEERMLADPSYVSFAHQHYSYVEQSRYTGGLSRWMTAYPRHQLLVLRSEDLYAEPQAVYEVVLEFLGLRSHRPEELSGWNRVAKDNLDPILRQQLFDELAPDVTAVAELLDRDMGWT